VGEPEVPEDLGDYQDIVTVEQEEVENGTE